MQMDRIIAQYSDFFGKNPIISNNLHSLVNSTEEVRYFTPKRIINITSSLTSIKTKYKIAESKREKAGSYESDRIDDFWLTSTFSFLLILIIVSSILEIGWLAITSIIILVITLFLSEDSKKEDKRLSVFISPIIYIILAALINKAVAALVAIASLLLLVYETHRIYKKAEEKYEKAKAYKKSVFNENKKILRDVFEEYKEIIGESFFFSSMLGKFKTNRHLIPIGIQTDKILSILNDMDFGNMISQIEEMLSIVTYSEKEYGIKHIKKSSFERNTVISNKKPLPIGDSKQKNTIISNYDKV